MYTFMCNLLQFITYFNIGNYLGETTLYVCHRNINEITKKFKTESLVIFEWFESNYLKANSGKSQLIFATDDKLKISVGGSHICD